MAGWELGGDVRELCATVGAILALGSAMLGTATAGEVEDAITAAMQDVDRGRCDQAYRRLAGVDGLESRAWLLAGQCRIRQGLYPEALADLDRVRGAGDLDREQVGDVELYRAVALYHLERYTEAAAALDSAVGLTGEEAQLALYRGLIALRSGDNDRAAPSLEAAARLAPAMTEPVASYYAGLAWQGASERTKAREAFQRVIALDGDGPWGREARKLLDSNKLYPYYVNGRVGMEYDDNVLLRGGVTQFAPGLSRPLELHTEGEKDWRGVWEIDGGVELWREDDWSAGVTAGYSGNAHFDLGDFNIHYPTIGAYVAHRFDSATTGQVRYQFGHAWIDQDPFMQTHIAEVGLQHTWEKAGVSVFVADVLWDDMRYQPMDIQDGPGTPGLGPCSPDPTLPCGPPGLSEAKERDRDGLGLGTAVEHRYLVPLRGLADEALESLEVGGGYRFRYFDSEGEEWEHIAHVLTAAIVFEFPMDFSLATRASYEYRDFEHASTFPDKEVINEQYVLDKDDREEHEVRLEAEIEKGLTNNLSVSARWSYLENESNRRVYDYTRHIVGGYLNFRFD